MVELINKPTIEPLREIKLFESFSDSELQQLLTLGKMNVYEAHTNIVIEGEMSWGLYLVLEGMLGIFKTNKLNGTDYDVGQLRKDSFFGELSLVDDSARSATVTALTPCNLFYISKENFISFLNTTSDLRLKFYSSCIKNLVIRLRELDDNYVISQYQLWQIALKKEAA